MLSKPLYANDYISNYLKISHYMDDHDNKISLFAKHISTKTNKQKIITSVPKITAMKILVKEKQHNSTNGKYTLGRKPDGINSHKCTDM